MNDYQTQNKTNFSIIGTRSNCQTKFELNYFFVHNGIINFVKMNYLEVLLSRRVKQSVSYPF